MVACLEPAAHGWNGTDVPGRRRQRRLQDPGVNGVVHKHIRLRWIAEVIERFIRNVFEGVDFLTACLVRCDGNLGEHTTKPRQAGGP